LILPTKGISVDRSLLAIGENVIANLEQPKSVTEAWEDLQLDWQQKRTQERLTFDWFALTLSMLYALRLIETTPDGRLRRAYASPSA